MPEVVLARLLFKHSSGATHVLFETQNKNDGLNLLVTAVARLSENATTLDTPQAFGYGERTLPKYKLAYEARMRNKLMKLAPGPEARVQRAANTAAEGRQNEGNQRERRANSTKQRTTKIFVQKPGTTNSTKQGTPRMVVPRPGATSATTKCRSRSVVTRQDKRGAAANRTKKKLVITSRNKDNTKSVTIINRNQPNPPAVFGRRKDGSLIRQMLYGFKRPEPSGDKGPTRFEGMLILSKIDKNLVGLEELSVRSDLEDMGLAAIASNADEIKGRRERTEKVCGIKEGAWKAHENDPQATKKDLLAAAACVVLVATTETGEKETLDAVTFVDANGNRVKQERNSVQCAWTRGPIRSPGDSRLQ
jgi:hypothetical protein